MSPFSFPHSPLLSRRALLQKGGLSLGSAALSSLLARDLTAAPSSDLTLPRAPPHSLMLSGTPFHPIPQHADQTGEAAVFKWSGKQLELREGGQAEKEAFRQQVGGEAMHTSVCLVRWWLC